MNYAIIQLGGKQLLVQMGKFYDVNRLDIIPGQTLLINKILLLRRGNFVHFGQPSLGQAKIRAKVLKHFKGNKLTVFKMQPKKNRKSKCGHRQAFTRLLIQNIEY
uniref:Large ribosomal subunit protein bL21m n=1 Tax=Neogoniolithon spectabile TaxID=231755 RepID=A0A3G3MH34_9FLOR|nr:ribosomal protein L21 [Neogoniolithon spectabile]AYR06146.1 ribosomal protein L21 [Neogoniolithon spectabile]